MEKISKNKKFDETSNFLDRKLEDKEDLTQVRHPLAKNIHRFLFETDVPKNVDNFLEGRMAYVFELDDEYAES